MAVNWINTMLMPAAIYGLAASWSSAAAAEPAGSGKHAKKAPAAAWQRAAGRTRPAAFRVPPLAREERLTLLSGAVVSRSLSHSAHGGEYIGGVSYQLVAASPVEVLSALQSVKNLPHALPKTQSARFIDGADNWARVELTQGNSLMKATYTVVLVRDRTQDIIRFWLDTSRKHDIRDVWGYFRVRRFDARRSLVTVAVQLDVGGGLVQSLFSSKIQNVILSTPQHIRDFVEPRVFAAR